MYKKKITYSYAYKNVFLGTLVTCTALLVTSIFSSVYASDSATDIRTILRDKKLFEQDSVYETLKRGFACDPRTEPCGPLLDRRAAGEDFMLWTMDDLRKWYACCYYSSRDLYVVRDHLNKQQKSSGDRKDRARAIQRCQVMGDMLTRMAQEVNTVITHIEHPSHGEKR